MNNNAIYGSVQSYLREVSRQQLCVYFNQNHFLSRDFDKWSYPEKETRSASIALTGYSGTVIIEAYFRHRDIARHLSDKMGSPGRKLSNRSANDFAGEFVNYVAGAVKKVLSPNRIEFNGCVPTFEQTSRAECNRIFKRSNGHHSGIWVLTDGKIEVVCISHLTITKLVPFRTIIPHLAMSLAERQVTGEVELFI